MKMKQIILWVLLPSLLLVLGGCYTLRTVPLERVDQEKLYTQKAYRISSVYLDDETFVHFRKNQDSLQLLYDLPETYLGPVPIGDTLHGELDSGELLALPIDKIASYRVRRFDPVGTVFAPGLAYLSLLMGAYLVYPGLFDPWF